MAKKIRDTLHGYIHLTKLEEALSQHPLLLRLHYVHQTSFTYLTYPNAHSTRYPHSLGVMHVAGEIFSVAIRNSAPDVRRDMAKQVREQIAHIHDGSDLFQGDLVANLVTEVSDFNVLMEPAYGVAQIYGTSIPAELLKRLGEDGETVILLALLHQAIRLAAMLHDVGHPPFSHIVEYALLEAAPKDYLGHEPKGMEIVDHLISNIDKDFAHRSAFKHARRFSELSLRLARCILENNRNSSFYGIKKTLLDGPIDADRLDYVRRDLYSAGLVPNYDIRRLVDAAFFRRVRGQYEIAFQPNCLSAFENFFIARYDLYRWMIYHHDVIRRNLAVQRSIGILLHDKSSIRETLRDLGRDIRSAACGPVANYRWFIDAFFVEKLWRAFEILSPEDAPISDDEKDLKLFLGLILERRNYKLKTIIKRPDEYVDLCRSVNSVQGSGTEHDRAVVKAFNDAIRQAFMVHVKGGSDNIAKVSFAKHIEDKFIEAIKAHTVLRNVRIFCYYIGTFQAGPDKADQKDDPMAPIEERRFYFSTLSSSSTPIWAEAISPSIAMLQQAWSYSPQLILFYTPPPDGPLEGSAREVLLEAVNEALRKIIGVQ